MNSKLKLLTIPLLAAFASAAMADLGVGSPAPDLKVATYVKGKPVDLKHGVHVVEFWATWCGPCKVSIPHLTEFAKKYEGKADFTGVSVYERGDNQLDQVQKFVAAEGPQMSYNVAFDGAGKYMATNWMEAAHQDVIPTAFLVKDGIVYWIGHPMRGLDQAIGQTVTGKFDLEAAKQQFQRELADRKAADARDAEWQELMKPVEAAVKNKDANAAMAALDKVEANNPEFKEQAEEVRLGVLMMLDDPRMNAQARLLADTQFKDNVIVLNSMAWSLIAPDSKLKNSDPRVAAYIAEKAEGVPGTKYPNVLETYALALFKSGQRDKAIEIEEKAIVREKGRKDFDPKYMQELKDRLAQFKRG